MHARQALEKFLTDKGIDRKVAADALKVSRTALYYWLIGQTSPGEQARKDIEIWTHGAITAESWGPVADHRKAQGEVKPFEPDTGKGAA